MNGVPLSHFEIGVIIGLKLSGKTNVEYNLRGSWQLIARFWEKWQQNPEKVTEQEQRSGNYMKFVKQTFLTDKNIQKAIKQSISNIPQTLHKIIEQKGSVIV